MMSKDFDISNFENVGHDEDGNTIGNCKLCGCHGVIPVVHSDICRKIIEKNPISAKLHKIIDKYLPLDDTIYRSNQRILMYSELIELFNDRKRN